MIEVDVASLEDDYEHWLRFVDLCPVGIARLDEQGDTELVNPAAVRLLEPITGPQVIDDLFAALGAHAVGLRKMVAAFTRRSGVICPTYRVYPRPSPDGKQAPGVEICLIKLAPGRLVAVIEEACPDEAQQAA